MRERARCGWPGVPARTAGGFDTGLALMAAEVDGDQMSFEAISRDRAPVTPAG